MRPSTTAGRVRDGRPRPGPAGLALAAALFLQTAAPARQQPPAAPAAAPGIEERTRSYGISAHLFIIGNLGDVGSMTIESALRANGGRLEKSLRMSGSANEAQIKKNRDFRGDFSLLKVYPLLPDGSVDKEAVAEWRGIESSSSGFLKRNSKYQAEKIAFFRDHAVSERENGARRRIEGSYGCILSPLEYMMDHDLRVGQVFETPFLLNGVPRIFRCEVGDLDTFSDYGTRAYRVDIWAVEQTTGPDKAPKDVWKKKGNVRVWFCKDGPHRNEMLRMKIKFRWYLWLYFDLKK